MSLFAAHFHQTFTFAPRLSVDARGREQHGPAQPHPCQYEPTTLRLVATDGTQKVTEGVIRTEAQVGAQDLVWPPGANPEDVGASRKPIRVTPRYDADGNVDHWEVFLGAA